MREAVKYLFLLMELISPNSIARNFSTEYQICEEKEATLDRRSKCAVGEILKQKQRLNVAYADLMKNISPEDGGVLEKVQRSWLVWRDGNYNFLSEHVAGQYVTTRIVSLNFLLNATYDRAEELEAVMAQIGH